MDFILIHPNIELKLEYLQRYKNRGNDLFFINAMNELWLPFFIELERDKQMPWYAGINILCLEAGEYLDLEFIKKKIIFKSLALI